MSKKKELKILNKIKSFLKEKTTHDKASSSDVEKAMNQLGDIVYDLISTKYKPSDFSVPIEFMLINRKTHQKLHYRPLPYINDKSSSEEISEYFRMLFMNNSILSNDLRVAEYEMSKIFKKKDNEVESLKKENEFLKSVNKGIHDADNKKVLSATQVIKTLKNKRKKNV